MPKLFHFDAYDECFAEVRYAMPAYCLAEVFVMPNSSNDIWKIIEKYSHPWKTQYRHDHLSYGVCISRCKNLMQKFDKSTIKKYFSSFSEPSINPFAFEYSIEDNAKIGKVINECINYEMKRKYQLKVNTRVQYCEVKGRTSKIGKVFKLRQRIGILSEIFLFQMIWTNSS